MHVQKMKKKLLDGLQCCLLLTTDCTHACTNDDETKRPLHCLQSWILLTAPCTIRSMYKFWWNKKLTTQLTVLRSMKYAFYSWMYKWWWNKNTITVPPVLNTTDHTLYSSMYKWWWNKKKTRWPTLLMSTNYAFSSMLRPGSRAHHEEKGFFRP